MQQLKTRLFLSITAIILFLVAAVSLLSNLMIHSEYDKHITRQQEIKTADILSNISHQYNEDTQKWNVDYIHGVGMYALLDGYIVKVYDAQGKTVWDAENHDMEACRHIMSEITDTMAARRPQVTGAFISHKYPIAVAGEETGSVEIAYYGPYFLGESDFNFLDTINIMLTAAGVVSLLLALAASSVLARHITSPVTKIVAITKEISEGNYAIRFEGKAKTRELAELTAAVNQLAEGLGRQESLRKRLTTDVAHELRTPLTTLSAQLEAMTEGVWEPTSQRLQSCYEEISRLTGLVADLEDLQEMESANLKLSKTRIDILEIVRNECALYEIALQKKELSLTIEGESVWVFADKGRISQVVGNLLSNAVKYTPAGGKIHFLVNDAGENVQLVIQDSGIGISEKDRPFVFERFYRADKSRNRNTGGAGIGLAIVKSIVQAHNGAVDAESSEQGGSRFILLLPKGM